MNKDKIAKELIKIAKGLSLGKSYSADARGIRHEVKDFIDGNSLYVICKVWLQSDKAFSMVSGNILRMGEYIKDGLKNEALLDWEVVGMTSDRNEARKKGDEV